MVSYQKRQHAHTHLPSVNMRKEEWTNTTGIEEVVMGSCISNLKASVLLEKIWNEITK